MSRQTSTMRAALVAGFSFAAFAPLVHSVAAQGDVTFATASKIVVTGTSNVHNWSCETTGFTTVASAPKGTAADAGKALTSMTVTIPVKSLDCGNGGMNDNLRKAMHADDHPTVAYRMTSFDAVPEASAYQAVIHGVLTINGTERPMDLKATITPDGAGGASAVGSTTLKTTDYGVPIVKVFLGTMRTSADVTITFNLTASRS